MLKMERQVNGQLREEIKDMRKIIRMQEK